MSDAGAIATAIGQVAADIGQATTLNNTPAMQAAAQALRDAGQHQVVAAAIAQAYAGNPAALEELQRLITLT